MESQVCRRSPFDTTPPFSQGTLDSGRSVSGTASVRRAALQEQVYLRVKHRQTRLDKQLLHSALGREPQQIHWRAHRAEHVFHYSECGSVAAAYDGALQPAFSTSETHTRERTRVPLTASTGCTSAAALTVASAPITEQTTPHATSSQLGSIGGG